MTRYRKKPFVIDAVQYLGTVEGRMRFSSTADWLAEATNKGSHEPGAVFRDPYVDGKIRISTDGHGIELASPEDWIIRGIEGEIYPCKDSVFKASYELAEPSVTEPKP